MFHTYNEEEIRNSKARVNEFLLDARVSHGANFWIRF